MSLNRRLVLAVLVAVLGGCNVCEFRQRCSGSTIESCVTLNDGPSITRRDCAQPNPTCVEPEEDQAICVSASESQRGEGARCEESFASRCESDLRVFCNTAGFIEASDCKALGRSGCRVDPARGGAVCE